jgi:hypothetical protein
MSYLYIDRSRSLSLSGNGNYEITIDYVGVNEKASVSKLDSKQKYIVTFINNYRRGLDWWLDLLATYRY